ncbi:MAG: hypothetical protein E7343_01900 [Clostridiales bacterium]|nr:hypothetical protein [Clostridiales bacterium]
MAQQNKGFIARMLEGKERSEEYARSTLPTNRWQLFWDIFKGNFGKIVKSNLLIFIFFIPMILVLILGSMFADANNLIYPFGASLTVGYPASPDIQGLSEMLSMQSAGIVLLGIVLTSFIAAIGLSGGMYVVRNMVWTEGIFVANDFWRGVKLNYKNALQTALFFSIVLALSVSAVNSCEFMIAMGGLSGVEETFGMIAIVLSYAMIVFAGMMSFWMIALGVNYEQKFFVLLKNSALITIGSLPQTIFFGVIALLPFALFLIESTFFIMISITVLVLFAFTWALLVWLDFAQWLFDKYINPKIEGAKVGRGIYNEETTAQSESQAQIEYRRALLAEGKSKLVANPIKPITDSLQVYELPQAFTREDLQKLRESKQNIVEDTEAYAEEHKNDLRYVEYNKMFEERERALQDADSKKKNRKPPKMLGE